MMRTVLKHTYIIIIYFTFMITVQNKKQKQMPKHKQHIKIEQQQKEK